MKNELKSQIMSLKAQVAVLEAQLRQRKDKRDFSDLYGLLRDEVDSSEEDIRANRYDLLKGPND